MGSPVFRPGGISYLEVPAKDPAISAAFYAAVFGWTVGGRPEAPSFEDGTGHVIGHWRTDLSPAGTPGIVPYVYVRSVRDTLDAAQSHGAEVVRPPYPEGNLTVATFRDPAGNVIGVWQAGV